MIDRQYKNKMISQIFSKIPVSFLGRLTRTNLIIPYYHIIGDEEILHVKHLYKYKTIRAFKEDLDILLKNYSPMSLLEILDFIRTDRPLPKDVFLLTFDDGYREMHDIVAPILLEKGISATFFVNSAFIDNKQMCYLNKASILVEQFQKSSSSRLEEKLSAMLHSNENRLKDIKSGILSIKYHQRNLLDEIADVMDTNISDYLLRNKPYLTTNQIYKLIGEGFTIGAHSVDHPLYSSLSIGEQVNQTIESVQFVRNRFHLSYGVFAFPHTDGNISREFFLKISDSGLIDLSFGTFGLMDDNVPNHFQRFSLEKPIGSADKIVAFQYARKLRKLVTRNPTIIRK
ncbi:MAG: polysaccharide deacetylase family protein [Thermodesulfobacteriota bacterium]